MAGKLLTGTTSNRCHDSPACKRRGSMRPERLYCRTHRRSLRTVRTIGADSAPSIRQGASQNLDGNSLGIHASRGWDSLPALAETEGSRQDWPYREVGWFWGGQGRHKAGACGDLMGLAGRGLAGHLRLGTCYEKRHPVDEACCWGGALRGRSPRTREGRLGPTAQKSEERVKRSEERELPFPLAQR